MYLYTSKHLRGIQTFQRLLYRYDYFFFLKFLKISIYINLAFLDQQCLILEQFLL